MDVTLGGAWASENDVAAWEAAGVDRLIVSAWQRAAEVLDAMEALHRFSCRRSLSLGIPVDAAHAPAVSCVATCSR